MFRELESLRLYLNIPKYYEFSEDFVLDDKCFRYLLVNYGIPIIDIINICCKHLYMPNYLTLLNMPIYGSITSREKYRVFNSVNNLYHVVIYLQHTPNKYLIEIGYFLFSFTNNGIVYDVDKRYTYRYAVYIDIRFTMERGKPVKAKGPYYDKYLKEISKMIFLYNPEYRLILFDIEKGEPIGNTIYNLFREERMISRYIKFGGKRVEITIPKQITKRSIDHYYSSFSSLIENINEEKIPSKEKNRLLKIVRTTPIKIGLEDVLKWTVYNMDKYLFIVNALIKDTYKLLKTGFYAII